MLLQALDDERVGRYIGGPDVSTLEALLERIDHLRHGPPAGRQEVWLNYAVLLDGTVIGRVEATVHDGIAEIAYVVGPRWWGLGYGSTATRMLLDELRTRGISEFWATVAPGNDASVGVLRHLGFGQVPPPFRVPLLSYDEGDWVFRHVDPSEDPHVASHLSP